MNLRSVFLSGLTTGTIILLSYSLSVFYSDGAFAGWHSLGIPPFEVNEVVAVYFDQRSDATILVSAAGHTLLQQGSRSNCSKATCWRAAESIPSMPDSGSLTISSTCKSDGKMLSSLPGSPIWCASYSDVSAGSQLVREVHFIMLEKGDIWVWQFIPGAGAAVIMFVGTAIGAISGLFVLYVLLRSRAK